MRNPVVLLRFVVFFFLLYLNVLEMGFAAWNIAALKSTQLDVSGAPIFILFNASSLLLYIVLSLVELVSSSFWSPRVMFECMWTAAFGILQLAAAIDVTITGPPVTCTSDVYLNACASSSLLVAISWFSSLTLLFYLFALIGITATHTSAQPAIWGSPVTSIAWYGGFQLARYGMSRGMPTDVECTPYENPVFKDDKALSSPSSSTAFESLEDRSGKRSFTVKGISISLPQSKSVEGFRPGWAKEVNARRGVDPPFVVPSKPLAVADRLRSYWSSTTASICSPPPVPPKAYTPARGHARRSANGDYIVDVPSDITLPVITPSPSRPISYGVFPDDVTSPDMPIEMCHRSEWITAHETQASRMDTHFGYAR